jgi:alpha-glucosidase (family GH31 glycosyl hydrolase)
MKIIPRLDLGISLMDKNSDLIYQANYSDSLI